MQKNYELIKSTQYPNKWNIFILLNDKEKHYKPKRFFGYFLENIKLLNVVRNRDKHLFKNLNSYGFNHEILFNFDDYKIDLYDDQTLVSGSWDKTVKFWSITNGTLIQSVNVDININALATLKSSEWD